MHELINPQTGKIVPPGSKIHTLHDGQAWTYRALRKVDHETHHVHATRVVKGTRGRTFQGHREFHPSVFGLDVRVSLTWERRAKVTARHALGKVDDYLLAGLFAIIPLAVFERLHMAGPITEVITFGMISGGSGH